MSAHVKLGADEYVSNRNTTPTQSILTDTWSEHATTNQIKTYAYYKSKHHQQKKSNAQDKNHYSIKNTENYTLICAGKVGTLGWRLFTYIKHNRTCTDLK